MQLSLKLAIWNANGISQHRLEVEHFLKSNHIDILLTSETHLTEASSFHITGYDLISAQHPSGSARGGAAIIIKSSIEFTAIESITENWVQMANIKI